MGENQSLPERKVLSCWQYADWKNLENPDEMGEFRHLLDQPCFYRTDQSGNPLAVITEASDFGFEPSQGHFVSINVDGGLGQNEIIAGTVDEVKVIVDEKLRGAGFELL